MEYVHSYNTSEMGAVTQVTPNWKILALIFEMRDGGNVIF